MKIKDILKYSPHYDEIITYNFLEDDVYSMEFVEYYQNYLYSIKELNADTIHLIEQFDKVMKKYIADNKFRNLFKSKVTDVSIQAIINFFNDYEEKEIKHINSTVWI